MAQGGNNRFSPIFRRDGRNLEILHPLATRNLFGLEISHPVFAIRTRPGHGDFIEQRARSDSSSARTRDRI